MNFREYIYRYQRKKRPRTAVYQSYASARRVLLLFESDMQERNVQIKALIKQLQADGKEVTAWGFQPEKKVASSAILRDYRVLAAKDFTFWGTPTEAQIADLTQQEFDLLIDLNVHQLLPLRYLSLYAQAQMRCGMQTPPPYASDLMIDLSGLQAPPAEESTEEEKHEQDINPAYLFDQIVHYLKNVEQAK